MERGPRRKHKDDREDGMTFFILSNDCLYWAILLACRFGLDVLQIRGAIQYIIENCAGKSFIKVKTFYICSFIEQVSHFCDRAVRCSDFGNGK